MANAFTAPFKREAGVPSPEADADPFPAEPLIIGTHRFRSRLFVGTGKYATLDLMRDCLAASCAEVVTVAVRRERLFDKQGRNLLDYLDPGRYTYVSDDPWRRWFKGTAGHNTVCVDDEDQTVHEDNINGITSVGIAVGDGRHRYSPRNDVRRGQMAAFLHRALD